MSKGKKLIILLVVAVSVIVGCVLLTHFLKGADEDSAENDNTIVIGAMEESDIAGIRYLSGKEVVDLVLEDGVWHLKSDRDFPVKQTLASQMATAAADLHAERLISESRDDFEEYGLSNPSVAYDFLLTDGSVLTYYIGNHNNFGDTYYLNVSGTDKIYLVLAEFLESFSYSLKDLADVPEMESASTESVTAVHVTLDGTKTDLLYYPEGLDSVYSRDFTWFKDPQTPADSVSANSYIGYAVDYSSGGCASYKVTGEQKTAFSLDAPFMTVSITYNDTQLIETGETDENDLPVTKEKTTTKTVETLLGGQAEDGSYYAMQKGSDVVYLVDAEYVDNLRSFNVDDLRSADVCMVRSADILSMDVTVGTEKKTIRLDRKDNSDSVFYFVDDKQTTGAKFYELYSSIQGMVGEGFASTTVQNPEEITVVYHTSVKNFDTVTLKFIPYDQNFYLVDLNGRREVLVNKQDVKSVEKAFQALTAS